MEGNYPNNGQSYSEIANEIHGKYLSDVFNPENTDYQILSTIRYDPKLTVIPPIMASDITKDNFFLLDEHYHRLVFTLKYFHVQIHDLDELDFEIPQDLLLSKLIEAITLSDRLVFEPMKVRLLVSLDGDVKIELHDTGYRDNLLDGIQESSSSTEDIWDVYIDKELTFMSPFTSFKTTNRKVYSAARERALPGLRPGKEEVLLINGLEQLMEGSITNVAIRRKKDGKWITPQLSSGCLCGVMRHFLLRKDFIEEETITLRSLEINTEILLFNGIMGVVKGKIVG